MGAAVSSSDRGSCAVSHVEPAHAVGFEQLPGKTLQKLIAGFKTGKSEGVLKAHSTTFPITLFKHPA